MRDLRPSSSPEPRATWRRISLSGGGDSTGGAVDGDELAIDERAGAGAHGRDAVLTGDDRGVRAWPGSAPARLVRAWPIRRLRCCLGCRCSRGVWYQADDRKFAVFLTPEMLDRIDQIVPPGAAINPADIGYPGPSSTPPSSVANGAGLRQGHRRSHKIAAETQGTDPNSQPQSARMDRDRRGADHPVPWP